MTPSRRPTKNEHLVRVPGTCCPTPAGQAGRGRTPVALWRGGPPCRGFRVDLADGGVHLAQWHAVLVGDPGTIFILGREHTRSAGPPAALAPHRAPRRLDAQRLALQLVAL